MYLCHFLPFPLLFLYSSAFSQTGCGKSHKKHTLDLISTRASVASVLNIILAISRLLVFVKKVWRSLCLNYYTNADLSSHYAVKRIDDVLCNNSICVRIVLTYFIQCGIALASVNYNTGLLIRRNVIQILHLLPKVTQLQVRLPV